MTTGITAPTNPINPTLITVIRYAVTAVAGLFVQRGIVTDDTAQIIVSAAVAVAVTVIGAYMSYRNAKVIIAVEPNVSDRLIKSADSK